MISPRGFRVGIVFWLAPLALSVGVALAGVGDSSLTDNAALKKALATLDSAEFGGALAWWAADERGGREPGTAGSLEAGARAAEEFLKLGLVPLGDEIDGSPSFFQAFERGGRRGLLPGHSFEVGDRKFEGGEDWSLLRGCDRVNLCGAEVVFAGYGITAPEYEYDDYEGLDAKGKVVLLLRYEPEEKKKDSRWNGASSTRHAYFNTKVENARKHGALAVLFVNGPLYHDPDRDALSSQTVRAGRNKAQIPMVHVRGRVAESLLERSGFSLRETQKKIDGGGCPASFPLTGVKLNLEARVGLLAKARNVIGYLEGSDPRLKEEVVVVGAHYDHLGRGAYGSRTPQRIGEVHNGADDNASGSVGVIELAEAIVESGLRPRRSILFSLFDAEEKGLLGSRHYVANPLIPLDRTVAMINLDMIARAKESKCTIISTGSAEEWEAILKTAEAGSPIRWTHRSGGGLGGSDHASFLRKSIPVLFFITGIHSEYHTPDDDVELCNMEDAVRVLEVALKCLLLVADRDDRLTFKKPASAKGRSRPRFGITIGRSEKGKPGIEITGVTPGGGAEKAGLRAGDLILSVDGAEVKGMKDVYLILGKHKPGDTVKVSTVRDDEENIVEVTLGG